MYHIKTLQDKYSQVFLSLNATFNNCSKPLWLVSTFGWFALCVWLGYLVSGKHSTGRIEAKESIEGESDATKVSSVKLNGMLF